MRDDAVVYHVYLRSFQDADGDGVGDLRGLTSRLDHLTWLGVDALWLSPFYPSPLADFGYDVSDHAAIDPVYGTLGDFSGLVEASHKRGLELLLDLVLCHTSIEHPWFRAQPERYVWSDRGPRNNWRASFGGSAWSPDPVSGRWYLHSFFPEQPDLDWRQPDVAPAMFDIARTWLERGADGFRLDALTALLKDSALRDDGAAREPIVLPLHPQRARLDLRRSRNSPELPTLLARLRDVVGDRFLVGEVGLPTASLEPYLDHLDAAFAFEVFHGAWDAVTLRRGIELTMQMRGRRGRLAWLTSNHDYPRLASRVGADDERVAAMLLLTLPGSVFIYQGDEIGQRDGRGDQPPLDRAGRDAFRRPMQWNSSHHAGFTTGSPWLPCVDPQARNVADQQHDPGSLLSLYRTLIGLRRRLGPELDFLDCQSDMLAYQRGEYTIALNLGDDTQSVPWPGKVILATHPQGLDQAIPAHSGVITRKHRNLSGRSAT
jgi:alpha-glucosidase